MITINVTAPFTLTKNDGSTQKFEVGSHEIDDPYADHPFVLVHTDKAPPYEPSPGTPEAGKAAALKQARKRLLKAAIEDAAEEEAAKH